MRYSEPILQSSRPGKYFLLLVFLSLLITINAIGQTKEETKLRGQAVKALNAQKFKQAQEIYTDLLKLAPLNPDYNYEMGLAIYEEGVHRGNAAPYFEKAIQNTIKDTLPELFLFAGKSEQFGGNFDIALSYYYKYISLMRKQGVAINELGEDVSRYMEMCENGKVQFENSKQFIILENMGDSINSEYPDYSPVVAVDESVIIFTSRRKSSTGGQLDVDDFYFEDIYYSANKDGIWTKATNVDTSNKFINSKVNTEAHDATITFSNNENDLYIYRDQTIWVSHKIDGKWAEPVKAQGRLNAEKAFEPSVFITQDEKTMFVVSELPIGYGGRDIYITTKDENGQWKQLQNLGRKVNTKHDEDAPFLTPDGTTLYFASTGHNSMGDYDIFKSMHLNGEWAAPENLGAPINTPGHDRYFVTTDNGAVGYYASNREGGFGETDVYRIILNCKAVSMTQVRGLIYNDEKGIPVEASITIYDPATNVIINKYKSDPKTGKYEMRLKTETKYGFKLEANGFLAHAGEFTVPKQCDYYSIFQEIKIENLKDEQGRVYAQRAVVNNAFFDIDNKVEQLFKDEVSEAVAENNMDSLRSAVAAQFNPIEITNFVSMIEVLDPEGVRIGYEIIGDQDVAFIQTGDELASSYNSKIIEADQYYYADRLPEARASYAIASAINPEELYPTSQLTIIEEKLKNAPNSAFLSTMPEEDKGRMIIPQLIDSSSLILPKDLAQTPTGSAKNGNTTAAPAPGSAAIPSGLPTTSQRNAQATASQQTAQNAPATGQVAASGSVQANGTQPVAQNAQASSAQVSTVNSSGVSPMASQGNSSLAQTAAQGASVPQSVGSGVATQSGGQSSGSNAANTTQSAASSAQATAPSGTPGSAVTSTTAPAPTSQSGTQAASSDPQALAASNSTAPNSAGVSSGTTQPAQPGLAGSTKANSATAGTASSGSTPTTGSQNPAGANQPNPAMVQSGSGSETQPVSAASAQGSGAARTGAEETIVFRNILFDFDKSTLRTASIEELTKIHNYLNLKPTMELRIDGHADWIGTVEYNLALSERRAKAAYSFLKDKGIKEQRLTFQHFGENVPIAPNANQDGSDNPEGRQLNRRCEFKLDQSGTADNIVLKF